MGAYRSKLFTFVSLYSINLGVRKIRILFVLFFTGFLLACSSIDGDAEKAAVLMDKSMDATAEYEFEEASEYYRQSKKIENKYKGTTEEKEFEEAYWKYRLKK